jgi:phosphoglycerol transferase MdoB-like AlkP superfamily enzyme
MERLRNIIDKIKKRPLVLTGCLALVLNFIVESLSRRSVYGCLKYMVNQPLLFFYNALIIMLTLSVALLTKKRIFFFALISILWLASGIANFVMLGFRTTPFAATDLSVLDSAIGLIGVYFSPVQIVLLAIGLVLLIAGIVFIWIKCPKEKIHFLKSVLAVLGIVLVLITTTNVSIKANAISTTFGNLAEAYEQYGFAYCFSCSIIDTGIDKPGDYSEEAMDEIMDKVGSSSQAGASSSGSSEKPTTTSTKAVKPNVIFVQLESFFDPENLTDISFSSTPVPVFHQLKENYSSGYLTVPAIGAGTANTEFEVLTGMSTDFFGAGEYPFKTVLKSSVSESIPYNLGELGYSSHAIHNHTSTFYGRNTVYSNLGFNSFSGIEYMNNLEYTPMGWAKDNVLTSEVMKALNSTDNQDFVFTVSVQGHGRYPSDITDDNQTINVSGIENAASKAQFEYYLTQIQGTDAFIGDLIKNLEDYDEPVVLVLYGDHLPSLGITNDELVNGSIYQTEYVIWNNMGLEKKDCDLSAYELSSHVMELLGYDNGILTKFHQKCSLDEDYQHDLELLEYDMLYGNKYVYNCTDSYTPSDMQMGTLPITIKDVSLANGSIIVTGDNFTEWSKVYIGDSRQETTFVDQNTLIVENTDLAYGDKITVSQAISDNNVLSTTDEFTFTQK